MTEDSGASNIPLPPGLTDQELRDAFAAIEAAIGPGKLVMDDLDDMVDPFLDPGNAANVASGVVSPTSVDDVRAIVRIASEHKLPIWPIGRGKNNGYGGAAPQVRGTLMLSFRNMNKVLEINEELGYAIVEPGVSWFDLHDAIEAGGHNLAASVVEIGWGSVVANTLEHGQTYLPYAIDQASSCGIEVVLPNGDLMRSGSGAMENNPSWPLYKKGFGPTATELFMQSNFGIVTKMGYWLMPKPEVYMPIWMRVWDAAQMPAVIDAMRELMMTGVLNMRSSLTNTLIAASGRSTRTDWYDGDGPIPEEIIDKIARELDLGRWLLRAALYGDEPIVDYNFSKLKKRFEMIPSVSISGQKYGADEFETIENPHERMQIGVPSLDLATMSGWTGGTDGGHVDFSPVIPLTGAHAKRAQDFFTKMCHDAGFDYLVGMSPINARAATSVNFIPFDTGDEGQATRAYDHAKRMVVAAGKLGYGEYRAHLSFMDLAAEQFGFNDHAQQRFNETIKDTLDPAGIIAPGKSGIWGSRFRDLGYPLTEG